MSDNTVRSYMRPSPAAIQCGTTLNDVVSQLSAAHMSGAPVVDEQNQILGFVSEHDCIRALLNSSYHCDKHATVNEVMSTEVLTVFPQDSIIDLAIYMQDDKPDVYPVVEANKLIGVISRTEVLRALGEKLNLCGQSEDIA